MERILRSVSDTTDFIQEVFENEVSEKIKVTMKSGSMKVKTHILLLPESFLRELLVATPECDHIIIPDKDIIAMEHLINFIKSGILICDMFDPEYGEEGLIDMMWFMLRFHPKEFDYREIGESNRYQKVLARIRTDKQEQLMKRKDYDPVNVLETKRQTFEVDDYTCKYCLSRFSRKDHMKVHLQKCSKANSKEKLQRGMKRDSQRKILCQVCGFSCQSKEAMRKHELTHSDGSNYKCPSCDKTYSLYHNLIRHIKGEDHKYPKGEDNLTKKLRTPYSTKCDICDRWVGRLEHHKQVHHSESSRVFACEHCDYKTNRKDNFSRHQYSMHKMVSKRFGYIDVTFKDDNPSWKCPECEVIFTSAADIENHLLLKNCEEIVCKICDKKFKQRQHMVQHIRSIHENPQTFKCNKCSKKYSHKSSLTKHLKSCS